MSDDTPARPESPPTTPMPVTPDPETSSDDVAPSGSWKIGDSQGTPSSTIPDRPSDDTPSDDAEERIDDEVPEDAIAGAGDPEAVLAGPDDLDGPDEPDEPDVVTDPDESGEADAPDESGEADAPDEADVADVADEADGAEEAGPDAVADPEGGVAPESVGTAAGALDPEDSRFADDLRIDPADPLALGPPLSAPAVSSGPSTGSVPVVPPPTPEFPPVPPPATTPVSPPSGPEPDASEAGTGLASSSKGVSGPEEGPETGRGKREHTHRAPADEGRRRLVDALGLQLTRGRLLAAALCAVLGFALVVQARQTQSVGLAGLRQAELVRLLDDVTTSAERLDETNQGLQSQLDELRTTGNQSEAAERVARERLDVLGILAGTSPATGPGIELTVNDPQNQVGAAILIDTIQELRDAGAEAMQVNGQRIVASSYFVDLQQGVRIDETPLRAPYEFVVIGDSQTLGAALEIPGGVLEVLRQRGADGVVTPEEEVEVSAIHSVPAARYAEPAPASS